MTSLKPLWFVTGATGGVGLALARHLAGQGAELLLTARNPLTLEQTASDLEALGGKVSWMPTDAAVLAQAEPLADWVRQKLSTRGPQAQLAGVVHASGLVSWKPQLTADGFDLALQVNALFPILLNLKLRNQLKASRLLLVAGAAGTLRGEKAPLTNLTEALENHSRLPALRGAVLAAWSKVLHAGAWARQGKAIWAFHPGFLRTGMTKTAPWPIRLAGALANPLLGTRSREGEFLIDSPEALALSGSLVEGRKPALTPGDEATVFQATLETTVLARWV